MEKKPVSQDTESELLKKVRAKEEEIERSLQEARLEAGRQIERMRQEAEKGLQKAQISIQEEVKRYTESRKQAINALIEKILLEARKQADLLHKEAQKNFDEALQTILSQILPIPIEKHGIRTTSATQPKANEPLAQKPADRSGGNDGIQIEASS